MSATRRLGAVMFLDMVGYSALMSRDQAAALACVQELEALMRELVPSAGGRLVKFLGDGTMAEFQTPGSAYGAAKSILDRIVERDPGTSGRRLEVRIGLHVGEYVEKEGDLFGDAVNVAARVMALADAGGIAMTKAFHDAIRGQFAPRGGFLPPRKLKNLPGREAVFVTLPEGASWAVWAFRRRARSLAGVAAALGAVAVAGWLYQRAHAGPVRVALLYIQAEGKELSGASKLIEEELALRVHQEPGFHWVDRAGILDLFEQEGIGDISKIEKLERKACRVARKGGLQYSLVGRLRRKGAGLSLESKIVCTKSLAVVGTLSSQAAAPEALAADQLAQLIAWAKSYDLLPARGSRDP